MAAGLGPADWLVHSPPPQQHSGLQPPVSPGPWGPWARVSWALTVLPWPLKKQRRIPKGRAVGAAVTGCSCRPRAPSHTAAAAFRAAVAPVYRRGWWVRVDLGGKSPLRDTHLQDVLGSPDPACWSTGFPFIYSLPSVHNTLGSRNEDGFPWWLSGKESACQQETWVRSLGWEDPLEKERAMHSSIPAWKMPWTEEPGGLQSLGSQSQT